MYQEQLPETMKKTPLKDTQNYTSNKSRKSFHAGQETEEATKWSLMPKVSPQISELSLTSNSGTNDLLTHTVQKCDPELAKARAHVARKNGGFLNVVPSYTPSIAASSKRTTGDLRASEFLGQKANTEPEICPSADVQSNERLIRLQMLLRQLEEADQSDYIQRLLQLSPLELSRHAVELEKRSIQLSVEEAMETKRMQVSNVFGSTL